MKPPAAAETDQYRALTFKIHQTAVPQGFSHLHHDDTAHHPTTPTDVSAGHKFGHAGHKIRHRAILRFSRWSVRGCSFTSSPQARESSAWPMKGLPPPYMACWSIEVGSGGREVKVRRTAWGER